MSEYESAITALVKSAKSTKEQFDHVMGLGKGLGKTDDEITKDIKAAFKALPKTTYFRYLPQELKRQYYKSPKVELPDSQKKTIEIKQKIDVQDAEITQDEPSRIEHLADYPETFTQESVAQAKKLIGYDKLAAELVDMQSEGEITTIEAVPDHEILPNEIRFDMSKFGRSRIMDCYNNGAIIWLAVLSGQVVGMESAAEHVRKMKAMEAAH